MEHLVYNISLEMSRAAPAAVPTRPDAAAVVTRAVLRAGDLLGLAQKDLAQILGVSPATLSRTAAGGRPLVPASKEGELALLLIRVFRAADALLGGKEASVRAWFHADNAHLGAAPAVRVRTIEGLVHVAEYLDAMRGKL